MREVTRPATTICEDIRTVEEFPPSPGTPGIVRVQVGRKTAEGEWIVPQQYETYTIEGEAYDELCAVEPPEWAPDKPPGTYRNQDLWHFVDIIRSEAQE